MKTHLVMTKPYTFDYYRPIFYTDNLGELQVRYEFSATAKGLLTPGMANSYTLVSDIQLEIDGELRNVRDADGTEIFVVNGLPYNLFVTSVEPQFDVYGRLVGWQHSATRAAD